MTLTRRSLFEENYKALQVPTDGLVVWRKITGQVIGSMGFMG